MEGDTLLNKDIQPLPPVDHSEIDYIEIGKDFYQQHQDISALSATEVAALRDLLKIQVIGRDVPAPCASFGHFGFDDILMRSIRANGFTEPTGIQKQAIPIALSGRDIIGIAKTGSGKTAAFLWPMLVHIMDQPELVKGDGPIALVLAPTRELAQQICSQAKKYGKSYNLKVNLVCGGASKGEQYKSLRKGGNEIVVGTPGRIIDLVKMKALDLRRVSYLVLDEADRMFDLGFEPQVRSICDNIRPDRQTLLFSATFKRVIERLARDILSEPVKIVVGDVGGANSDVTQVFQILPDHSHKWGWLIRNLVRFEVDGSVIIFVGRKLGVDELTSNLRSSGFQCAALHGDMTQDERDTTLRDFRSNKLKIMATSDVAARGLDIKGVRTVINYDVARDIDLHVHRIGRTGRAGEKGTAYTLITEAEDAFAATLVQNLQDSNLHVPEELLALAQRNGNFRRGHGAKSRGRGATRGQGRGARGRGGITQRNESHIGNMQSSANSFSNSIRFTPASSQQGRSTSAISRDTGNV
ncbi:P-loop containing nucleoside triphosphate hydrolase protein [Phlyctochytrium arcticum]|nr:P-loop containing nucleoside triphosphate hydrolase protein [Phlyctochytrium arcticum]